MAVFGQLPADPATIANEIIRKVRRLAKDGRPDWSREIKKVLTNLGNAKGYYVYPDPKKRNREWLLDLIWLDKKTGSIRLAVESELGNENEALDDFQKLLCVKAPLKVMIFYVYDKPFLKKFVKYMTDFDQHVEGEHYLLIEFAPGRKGPADHAYAYPVPSHLGPAKVKFTLLPGSLKAA